MSFVRQTRSIVSCLLVFQDGEKIQVHFTEEKKKTKAKMEQSLPK